MTEAEKVEDGKQRQTKIDKRRLTRGAALFIGGVVVVTEGSLWI